MFKLKNLSRYQRIFIFSIILILSISALDIACMNSGLFGTPENYLVGNYTPGLWDLFYKIGLGLVILSCMGYFFLARQDKSETIALFISSLSFWMVFGLADLTFFWFRLVPVPSVLTWLNKGYIGWLSRLIGFSQVTNIALYVCVAIGLVFNYYLIKILVKKY